MNKRIYSKKIAKINDDVLELFRKQRSPRIKLLPMLYDHILFQPDVLFMGINPSFNAKTGHNIFKKCPGLSTYNVEQIQAIHSIDADSSNPQIAIKMQRCAKNYYDKYFKALKDFAGNKKWDHIDLFFERNTDYRRIRVFNKNLILSRFGFEQLKFTKRLLVLIQPRNLIIANRVASNIFSIFFAEWMTYDGNHHYGTLKLPGNPECRVFFSLQWSSPRPEWIEAIKKDKQFIKKYLA
jgi:hypothetical protein